MSQEKKPAYDLTLYVDEPDKIAWDIEVDVLVIGGGGCGLVAALAGTESSFVSGAVLDISGGL